MITQERLKELLHYDPDTGVFARLMSRGNTTKGNIAGNIETNGYVVIYIDGKSYKAHRLAWLYVNGYMPSDQTDHINQDRSDNRIANLREVDRVTNGRNQRRASNNTSGIEGKLKYLGLYKCKEEAHQRRREAEKEYNFHENHGRDHTCST